MKAAMKSEECCKANQSNFSPLRLTVLAANIIDGFRLFEGGQTSRNKEFPVDKRAFQDCYPEELSHCYGCGKNNTEGHQLKSYWDGDETIAHFLPSSYHIAIPGFVYGGLIASLIDCHGTATASAAACRAAGIEMGTKPGLRFVTGSIKVVYLAPTPLGVELELRGVIVEIKERKVTVDISLSADGRVCAKGEVIAVLMPENMMSE